MVTARCAGLWKRWRLPHKFREVLGHLRRPLVRYYIRASARNVQLDPRFCHELLFFDSRRDHLVINQTAHFIGVWRAFAELDDKAHRSDVLEAGQVEDIVNGLGHGALCVAAWAGQPHEFVCCVIQVEASGSRKVRSVVQKGRRCPTVSFCSLPEISSQ